MVSWNFNTIQRFWVLLAYFCFLWFLGTVNNILLHPLNNPLELLSYYWWRQRKVKVNSESRSVLSDSLRPHGLHSPWNYLHQNIGVVSPSLLQGIFPTQQSNPGLPRCRRILYQLGHQGNLRILEWVAYPCSSRSLRCRNWTGVSCIAGRLFTSWATTEASTDQLKRANVPFLPCF